MSVVMTCKNKMYKDSKDCCTHRKLREEIEILDESNL